MGGCSYPGACKRNKKNVLECRRRYNVSEKQIEANIPFHVCKETQKECTYKLDELISG